MTTSYRIYWNHGNGGRVDYSTPLATTASLSYVPAPLGVSSDNTFVVRAFDPDSGLEQAGSEASTHVVVGPDGRDASGLPNAPHALVLSPAVNGGARVSWAYAPVEPWVTPTGFDVFLTTGSAVDYSSPSARVPYSSGQIGYSCVLPGPYPLSAFSAAVRSFNAAGTDKNTVAVGVALGVPAAFAMDPVQVNAGFTGP